MGAFKITEIINATTIRTAPKWALTITNNITNELTKYSGDRVIITGLKSQPNDEYVKDRLSKVLLNKEVDLFNATLVDSTDHNNTLISCQVYIDKTNVVYYFPEYSNEKTTFPH